MLNVSDIANPTIKLRPMKSLRRTNYVFKVVSLNDRISLFQRKVRKPAAQNRRVNQFREVVGASVTSGQLAFYENSGTRARY